MLRFHKRLSLPCCVWGRIEILTRRNLRRLAPGLLVSAISLGIVLYFVDFESLLSALRLADYRLVVLAMAFFLVSLVARGLAWRTLLLERVSLGKLILTINEGYLLNNLLPFRLGEVGRAFLLSRTVPGLDFWQVASTILVERAFDVVISAGMLLITLPFILAATWAQQAAIGIGTVVVVGLIALHLLARNRERFLVVFLRLGNRWPILQRVGEQRIRAFFTGLAALTDLQRFLRSLGWMVLVWALTLVEYYLALRAFVPEAELLWVAFALGVTAMGVAVPSSPGYVGIYEAALVGALSVFDVEPSIAFAYAVTIHLMFWVITAVIGVIGLVRDGVTLGQVYQRVRQQADVY